MSESAEPVVRMSSVRFSWDGSGEPDLKVDALDVAKGEHLFVEGPSGSGKSTLLGLLAGVIQPQSGTVEMLGKKISALGAAERDKVRAEHLGYIFQMFNLIPYLSVIENVTLPLNFSSQRSGRVSDPKAEATRLLEHLGMGGYRDRTVTKLSVGQQQRVAAARALIGAPEILLADEPTSALDEGHSEGFIDLLFQECKAAGTTLVFVSHDRTLARLFDRSYSLG